MRIYFHGNCQATVMAKIWRETFPDHDVRSNEVHSMDLSLLDVYKDNIYNSDLIVTQIIADNYRQEPALSTKWIEANASSKSRLVKFPVLFFQGQAPQTYYLHGIPNYKSGYHDIHIADFFVRGIPQKDAVRLCLSEDFVPRAVARKIFDGSVEETIRREAAGDVDFVVSDIYNDYGKKRSIFHTINHPTRFTFKLAVERLMNVVELRGEVPSDGPDHLSQVRIPPYPSVCRSLGLSDDLSSAPYRVNDDPETAEAYLSGLFEHYAKTTASEKLHSAIQQNLFAKTYLELSRQHTS